eukprot:11188431-Prorocentrum_lima.AAC.1
MTSSLVGSEMCIRDRCTFLLRCRARLAVCVSPTTVPVESATHTFSAAQACQGGRRPGDGNENTKHERAWPIVRQTVVKRVVGE